MRYGEEIILLGKSEKCSLSAKEKQLFMMNNISTENCLVYQKMIYKRIRYTCTTYCNDKLNNDSYILISSEEKVVITLILRFPNGIKLIVQQLNIHDESVIRNKNIKSFHIRKVDSYDHLKCVDVCQMPFGCYGD